MNSLSVNRHVWSIVTPVRYVSANKFSWRFISAIDLEALNKWSLAGGSSSDDCALRTAAGSASNLLGGVVFAMNEIRRFIEWLSFHPSSDDIARALVTDYLSDLGVCCMRFGRINNDDSAIALGQYGYADADQWRNLVVPGTEWRNWDLPAIDIMTGKNKSRWAPDSKLCVITLRDRGVIQGHAVFEFAHPIADSEKESVIKTIDDLCVPIALYQSFQNRGIQGLPAQLGVVVESRDLAAGQLTQRQILILRGMVEGKTNHELATEMGFSVSTIRHETMRIYQALAVSDRKEAAKKALTLSLI